MLVNMNREFTCLFLCICGFTLVACEEGNFFLKAAAKSVPRIGRSPNKQNNADFEKFFLKASKSVPRIGRRNEATVSPPNYEYYDQPSTGDQRVENYIKHPMWYDIADRYEYDPELFQDEGMLDKLMHDIYGSNSHSEWDKVRFKRNIPGQYRKPLYFKLSK